MNLLIQTARERFFHRLLGVWMCFAGWKNSLNWCWSRTMIHASVSIRADQYLVNLVRCPAIYRVMLILIDEVGLKEKSIYTSV